jgi:hypothetical protein
MDKIIEARKEVMGLLSRLQRDDEKPGWTILRALRGSVADDRETLKLIDERDAAEQALSQAYYLVTGRSPEWSNMFGHKEALDEIEDTLIILRKSIPAPT